MDNQATESSNEPLDMSSAAEAFGALMGGDDDDSQASDTDQAVDDSPEAAAERLAKQELSGNEEEEVVAIDTTKPQTFIVNVDGKDVVLTAAEIAENHKNGLRQADYTRKTMEAAEARKAAEAEASKAAQERAEFANKLTKYAISTEAQLDQMKAKLTQELFDSDIVEYLTIERTLKEGQSKLAEAQGELSKLTAQQQQEREAAQSAYFQDQREQLLAKVPEWKDEAKQQAEVSAMQKYLTALGFAPEEQVFPDHRLILMARDAAKLRKLEADGKLAVAKIGALPTKVERSGAPDAGTDRKTEAMKRLGKTGSVSDAANAFSHFL